MMIETISNLFENPKNTSIPLKESLKSEKTDSKEKTDSINLSPEALEALEKTKEETEKDKVEELKKQMEMMKKEKQANEKQMKSMKSQVEEEMEVLNNLGKCMTISSRIIGGDRVPLKDERFLSKNQPEMYARAIMLRRQKKDPKDYKSILEDQDKSSEDLSEMLQTSPTSTELPSIEQGGAETATPEAS